MVPTLFSRDDFLLNCLESIRAAGEAHVMIMGPDVEANSLPFKGLFDQLVEEPESGNLSSKLNFALESFPENIRFVTWLGDDDLLEKGSLGYLEKEFENRPEASLIYGSCNYINTSGEKVGKNKSGKWAISLSKFGPFLAPQPGSLFRRDLFENLGGLDSRFDLAFDFDLFLALSKLGDAVYVNRPLASFRWHTGSLSVSMRKKSVSEASVVRVKHASGLARILIFILNPIVERATLAAGVIASRKSGR